WRTGTPGTRRPRRRPTSSACCSAPTNTRETACRLLTRVRAGCESRELQSRQNEKPKTKNEKLPGSQSLFGDQRVCSPSFFIFGFWFLVFGFSLLAAFRSAKI